MIRLQDKHEYEVETADATMYLFGDLAFDKDAYTITYRDEVAEAAKQVFHALGGTGFSRVDFFVEKETGRVLFNEINTIPGFTSISMYPKMMEAAGVPYGELCDRLLQLAEEKWS